MRTSEHTAKPGLAGRPDPTAERRQSQTPEGGLRALTAGDLVGARYRLEQVAGTGGMATVWRAHDEQQDTTVAIKVMSDVLAANAAAVTRFAREARTHAKIQHPNLVKVFDYSVTATQPYLVMEYIDGATLSELLSAIAAVHDNGVLHRDIKPANVLIDHDDRARLTDFGLARLEESSRITHPDEIVGTLRFLAPELLEGSPSTRQSDLYALGVLLRTAAGETEPTPAVAGLIEWLTDPDPHARPRDAHAALERLEGKRPRRGSGNARKRTPPGQSRQRTPPARSRQRPPRPSNGAANRHDLNRTLPAENQLRNRLIAISALLAVITGTAVVVADQGSDGTTAVEAAYHRHAQAAPGSVDQQLQRLARAVRRAAAP